MDKSNAVATDAVGRVPIISLKGTREMVDWLETVHRNTHIPKATIMRLGLAEWAKSQGQPLPPMY